MASHSCLMPRQLSLYLIAMDDRACRRDSPLLRAPRRGRPPSTHGAPAGKATASTQRRPIRCERDPHAARLVACGLWPRPHHPQPSTARDGYT
eukprot:scaffold99696_cov31-Tisochrysis_lutea.AAC.1